MSIAHRTLRFAPDRVVLMSGGCFYKLKGKEEGGTSGTEEEDYTMRYVLEAGTFMYETFADPCRELEVSDEELRLLRAVAFFQPVPRLSPKGREAVLEAQHFYRGLAGEAGSPPASGMGALLSLLPPVEFASQIEDTFMSLATLFNVGEMEGDLTCDLYLRRKGRY
ncbi:Nuclear hormone receptor domain containing protein [Aphelenchoides fujianensis]|nr:Nuclear hormone receptor domain containing protein [Aphelenchoides fujianensis]